MKGDETNQMQEIPYNVLNISADSNKPDILDIVNFATDTGYVDTASFILDNVCWITGKSKREHIRVNGKWILKPSLMVDMITSQMLEFDFEEKVKIIEQEDGKVIKQIYYVNDRIDGCVIYYNPMRKYTSIFFQHHQLLGKLQKEVVEKIKWIFQYYFLIPQEYVDRLDRYIKLSRIDFKRDYRYRDEQELALIKQIIDIAPSYIVGKNYIKVDEKEEHEDWDNFDDYVYMKKYKTESNATAEFVIYDKQLEQESKFRDGKITQEQLDYYQNVIRFEVRIKDKKLNNLKSDFGISKELDNYKDERVAEEYFSKYAELAFFKQPFYRIDYAIRLINKGGEKPKMKKKLIELLKEINENGYTYTQQHYKFSDNIFRNHIKKLKALNINPLTLKQVWKDKFGNEHKTTYTKIPNFIQKQSCLEEDDYVIPSKYRELVEQAKSKKVIDIS